MSVDVLGTSWDQCQSMVQYSFMSTETRRLVRTDNPGWPPRLSHSSWTRSRWTSATLLWYFSLEWWPKKGNPGCFSRYDLLCTLLVWMSLVVFSVWEPTWMHFVHQALQTRKILCENLYVPYNFWGSFIHSRYRDRLMLHRKVIFPALNVGHVNLCSSCYSFTMIDSIQLSWF